MTLWKWKLDTDQLTSALHEALQPTNIIVSYINDQAEISIYPSSSMRDLRALRDALSDIIERAGTEADA